MKPLFIETHIIQTVPPSNINRDDTGSPKTAIFGGVPRARVSSQAWKRATRDAFRELADELLKAGVLTGDRTKHAIDMVAAELTSLRPDLADKAVELATDAIQKTLAAKPDKEKGITETKKDGQIVTKYILGITLLQAERLASLCADGVDTGQGFVKAKGKEVLKQDNAVDIALFGRMVAEDPSLNVDAACQVAHAIGIHKSEPEFDYFTAVDDRSPDDNAGAGMIGTVEFTSSTLYRYATLNVPLLRENLGSDEATTHAVQAFVQAFITSMPTGKQNTFANRTLPAAIVVQLRDTQPVSLVNAFEKPINADPDKGEGRIEQACKALVDQETRLDKAFGTIPLKTYVVSAAPGTDALAEFGPVVSLRKLIRALGKDVRQALASHDGGESQ